MVTVNYDKIDMMDEHRESDAIFSNNDLDSRVVLEHDREYIRPSIKTWVYTNMTEDVWMSETAIPMLVPVNKDVFVKLKIFRKSVVIIKTYDFKFSNKDMYNHIIRNLFTDMFIDSAIRQKVIDKLTIFKNREVAFGENEKLRFIYTIDGDELINNKGVRVENTLFSVNDPLRPNGPVIGLNAPNTAKNECSDVVMKHHYDLELLYTDHSGKDMTIKMFDKEIEFKACPEHVHDPSTFESDSIYLNITDEDGPMFGGIWDRSELRELGKLVEKKKPEDEDKPSPKTEKDLKLIESMDKRFDNNMTVIKFMHEHNVSLHKLFSYIIREETAILALRKDELSIEKEEISTAKELLKLLGTIK